ncbi:MAG: SOS response-associated peptidase [Pseudomonadota bacterium]|nr:MAG: SOS response-associated peptidase [Pseudomonadota bacterium]
MCGRFTLGTDATRIARSFGLAEAPALRPAYNIAPNQPIAAIRLEDGQRHCRVLRWGLVPAWSKGPDSRFSMINARAETVANKPAYRGPLRHRRCLVPADGFYEWQARDGAKQPWYIYLKDRRPFAMAGLWDRWEGPEGEIIESCTLLTTDANSLLAAVHERMPVILAPDIWTHWLDPQVQDVVTLTPLLAPYPAAEMACHRVSTAVNRPQNDNPDLIEPLQD